MKLPTSQRRAFGETGLTIPPIALGTASLANLPDVIPEQRKLAICGEWFRCVEPPVFVDVAYDHGDGMALEVLGRILRRLEVAEGEVIVHLTLDSAQPLECWEKSCRLLGDYRPKLVSVLNADDDALRAVGELKVAGMLRGVGVAVNDVRALDRCLPNADWVLLGGGFTVLRHPPESVAFLSDLAKRHIPVVMSDAFDGGFLVGGNRFAGRVLSAVEPSDRSLLAWRTSFAALCHGHGVSPAHACVQFALSGPGVVAVQLESSDPDQVAENVEAVAQRVPDAFWAAMKEERLLEIDSPLGA